VPAAVALVLTREGVLLTRRAHPPYAGTWDLPGGFLEAGESPPVALARELEEELGVRARPVRLIGIVTDEYGPKGFSILTLIYRVALTAGRLRPADDVAEARWFPVRAVPFREIAFRSMREALRSYLTRVTDR
jgi:8-oxo-dGTP diphosphatase